MKFFIIQTLLLGALVVVNLPFVVGAYGVNALAATITLVLVLILLSLHNYLQQRRCRTKVVEDKELSQNPPEKTESEAGSSLPVGECHTLSELMAYLQTHADAPSQIAALDFELKTYQQCYIWIKRMEEMYGDKWRKCFQEAEMPIQEDDFPQMRSLIMEIALHTVDFCRYRTNYINLTDKMKVNPSMILLEKEALQAGAEPFTDDPFHTNKEVRALHALAANDGIRLKNATLHGYYES